MYLAAFLAGPEKIGLTVNRLYGALVMEFAAIHAFPLLMLILGWTVRSRLGRAGQAAGVIGLSVFYSAIAADYGKETVAAFWLGCFVTYAGFWMNPPRSGRLLQLIVRWLTAATVYMASLLPMGLASLMFVRRAELLFGFFYFLTLAALEAASFYEKFIDRHFEKLRDRLYALSRPKNP